MLIARLAWHRTLGPLTIGAMSSGYVNGNNIGLPVAVYLLGNAAFTAPILLLQLIVLAPTGLILLDAATHEGRRSVAARCSRRCGTPSSSRPCSAPSSR